MHDLFQKYFNLIRDFPLYSMYDTITLEKKLILIVSINSVFGYSENAYPLTYYYTWRVNQWLDAQTMLTVWLNFYDFSFFHVYIHTSNAHRPDLYQCLGKLINSKNFMKRRKKPYTVYHYIVIHTHDNITVSNPFTRWHRHILYIAFITRTNKMLFYFFYFIFNPLLQCFSTPRKLLVGKINCLSSSTFFVWKRNFRKIHRFQYFIVFRSRLIFTSRQKKPKLYLSCLGNLARQQYFDDFSITANGFIYFFRSTFCTVVYNTHTYDVHNNHPQKYAI